MRPSILNKLSFRTKLFCLVIIPLIISTIMLGNFCLNKRTQMLQQKSYYSSLKASDDLDRLIYELQKERGLSAGYLGSQGKFFQQMLLNQYKITDKAIAQYKKDAKEGLVEINHEKKIKQKGIINSTLTDIEKVKALRKRVLEHKISIEHEIRYYSKLNARLIFFIQGIALQTSNAKLTKLSLAHSNLRHAKEQAGILRATVSVILGKRGFHDGRYYDLASLIYSYDTYL